MAIRVFPWGSVRSTAKNIVLSFPYGINVELSNSEANWLVRCIFVYTVTARYGLFSRFAFFEWDPMKTKPGPRSVLKIWYRNKTHPPTLLSYDEATELIDAIRTLVPKPKVAKATP